VKLTQGTPRGTWELIILLTINLIACLLQSCYDLRIADLELLGS